MIKPEVLDAMVAAGCTAEQIVAAVKADAASDDVRAAEKRAADAARKRRQRANVTQCHADIEGQDGTQGDIPSPKKETSPAPLKEKTTPSSSEANASSSAAEVDLAFDAWDAMASRCGLATVRVRSKARRSGLASIIRQHGFSVLIEAIGRVEASDFCRGENDRGWRADLDFLLQAKSFGRLIEGHFENRAGQSRASPPNPGNAAAILLQRRQTFQQQVNSDDERSPNRPHLIAAR